jgi:ribosomal protein S11
MTFRRRNTFINLGYVDFISTIRQSLKRRKFKNPRGRYTRTLTYISGGLCGLKGAKKAAPMANLTIGAKAAATFKKFNHTELLGRFFGSGRRRKELMKGLVRNGLLLRAL